MSSQSIYQQAIERVAAAQRLSAEQFRQIRRAKDLMLQHYHQPLELAELASAAGFSRYHFIRIFQRVYGLTPRQYLKDLRLAKARERLQQGQPVSVVCDAVGYLSLPTFSRAFKQGYGVSPRQYQQTYQQTVAKDRNRE